MSTILALVLLAVCGVGVVVVILYAASLFTDRERENNPAVGVIYAGGGLLFLGLAKEVAKTSHPLALSLLVLAISMFILALATIRSSLRQINPKNRGSKRGDNP